MQIYLKEDVTRFFHTGSTTLMLYLKYFSVSQYANRWMETYLQILFFMDINKGKTQLQPHTYYTSIFAFSCEIPHTFTFTLKLLKMKQSEQKKYAKRIRIEVQTYF